MEMSVGTLSCPCSVVTLPVVSQGNVLITLILVSISPPSALPPFSYCPKGYIHRGGVWYVSWSSVGEIITYPPLESQFAPSVRSLCFGMISPVNCHP